MLRWGFALLANHFDGLGWKVPAALKHLDTDDDFYFDRINQIRMPFWSKRAGSRQWVSQAIAYRRWQAWAARWQSLEQDGLRKR